MEQLAKIQRDETNERFSLAKTISGSWLGRVKSILSRWPRDPHDWVSLEFTKGALLITNESRRVTKIPREALRHIKLLLSPSRAKSTSFTCQLGLDAGLLLLSFTLQDIEHADEVAFRIARIWGFSSYQAERSAGVRVLQLIEGASSEGSYRAQASNATTIPPPRQLQRELPWPSVAIPEHPMIQSSTPGVALCIACPMETKSGLASSILLRFDLIKRELSFTEQHSDPWTKEIKEKILRGWLPFPSLRGLLWLWYTKEDKTHHALYLITESAHHQLADTAWGRVSAEEIHELCLIIAAAMELPWRSNLFERCGLARGCALSTGRSILMFKDRLITPEGAYYRQHQLEQQLYCEHLQSDDTLWLCIGKDGSRTARDIYTWTTERGLQLELPMLAGVHSMCVTQHKTLFIVTADKKSLIRKSSHANEPQLAAIPTSQKELRIEQLVSSSRELFLLSRERELFCSLDEGSTWILLSSLAKQSGPARLFLRRSTQELYYLSPNQLQNLTRGTSTALPSTIEDALLVEDIERGLLLIGVDKKRGFLILKEEENKVHELGTSRVCEVGIHPEPAARSSGVFDGFRTLSLHELTDLEQRQKSARLALSSAWSTPEGIYIAGDNNNLLSDLQNSAALFCIPRWSLG